MGGEKDGGFVSRNTTVIEHSIEFGQVTLIYCNQYPAVNAHGAVRSKINTFDRFSVNAKNSRNLCASTLP
jgi:hypothetical protein